MHVKLKRQPLPCRDKAKIIKKKIGKWSDLKNEKKR